jgi:hypothetical protein
MPYNISTNQVRNKYREREQKARQDALPKSLPKQVLSSRTTHVAVGITLSLGCLYMADAILFNSAGLASLNTSLDLSSHLATLADKTQSYFGYFFGTYALPCIKQCEDPKDPGLLDRIVKTMPEGVAKWLPYTPEEPKCLEICERAWGWLPYLSLGATSTAWSVIRAVGPFLAPVVLPMLMRKLTGGGAPGPQVAGQMSPQQQALMQQQMAAMQQR